MNQKETKDMKLMDGIQSLKGKADVANELGYDVRSKFDEKTLELLTKLRKSKEESSKKLVAREKDYCLLALASSSDVVSAEEKARVSARYVELSKQQPEAPASDDFDPDNAEYKPNYSEPGSFGTCESPEDSLKILETVVGNINSNFDSLGDAVLRNFKQIEDLHKSIGETVQKASGFVEMTSLLLQIHSPILPIDERKQALVKYMAIIPSQKPKEDGIKKAAEFDHLSDTTQSAQTTPQGVVPNGQNSQGVPDETTEFGGINL